MDIKKVLQKINVILTIENRHDIQSMLDEILAHYQSKNPDDVDTQKALLEKTLQESELNNFLKSDLNILEGLGIRGYFDMESIQQVDKLLQGPEYRTESKLQEFINKRGELLQNIRNLKSSIDQLEIKEEKEYRQIYQIVFVLPSTYRNLGELEKFLKDTKNLLNRLNSAIKGSEPPKITSINNGSIEMFIESSKELAESLSTIIGYISKIYTAIRAYHDGKKVYESYSKTGKTKAENLAKQELDTKKESLIDDLINTLSLKTPEEKVATRKLFGLLVKHIENGTYIELKTPSLQKPEEISEKDDAKTKNRKQRAISDFKKKQHIDQINKELLQAQKTTGIHLELPRSRNNKEGSGE